jgi:acyl-CoA thioester hydrolase
LTHGPFVVGRVRWSDVDKMDVMYYGAYLQHTDAAEAEFFRAAGYTYDRIRAEHGIWLARVHLEVRYRAPARLDDDLTTRATLVKLGGSSLHFSFAIDRVADGARLAEVGLVLAALDAESLKATRLPSAFRTALTS